MKFFTKKSTIQKILVVIILILVMNFTITPYYSYANVVTDGMSSLAKELLQLLAWFGDVIMSALNNFMLGANGFGSSMLDKEDPNLDNPKSWLYVEEEKDDDSKEEKKHVITFDNEEINTKSFFPGIDYNIPNMLYSPENIFSNRIAALDVNFLRENKYDSIYAGGTTDFKNSAKEKSESSATALRDNIASWYKSFRNIAVVGLLSVLVYIGIRILISSTAADKAKYKENLRDWLVALCLVFFIHFIMSAVLMVTDKCTELFSHSISEGYTVVVKGGKSFNTNLMGLIRFNAQASTLGQAATYTILYIALVIYTCVFTFLYFKRFLYMAFFTMIAPLVALTYPIDKVGDGKAQAFNMWFKEYTMNAIIQPVHLILYAVFVGSAYDLAAKNPIYALVAIAFLIPAEKFIKQMFGLNKAESTGGFGSFAGGALAMKGLQNLSKIGNGGNDKGKGKSGSSDEEGNNDIFMPPSSTGELSSFNSGEEESSDNIRQNVQENEEAEVRQENQPIENKNNEELSQLEQQLAGYDETDPYFMDPAHQELQEKYQNLREQQEQAQQAQQPKEQPVNAPIPLTSMQPQPRTQGAKPQKIKGYAGRMLARGAKAAGKQIWKHKGGIVRAGMKAAGAVTGGAVGLAAGLTTGDLSKTMSFMGAGALAGSAIGANAQRAVTNLGTEAVQGVKNAAQSTQRVWNEEKFGYSYAREKEREQQNKKARKTFLKDDEQKRQYKDLAAKMGYKGDVKNLMEAAADYKEAGITNDKLIQNSLQAEYARHGSVKGSHHNKFVEVASFAHENNFSRDNITDSKKREQLDSVINTVVPGDEKAKREAALMYADIFDSRKTYEKYGKFGSEKLQKEKQEAAKPKNSAS